jgi:hypothetical protein
VDVVATSTLVTALGIPALLAAGGFLAWAIRSTIEDYREAERQLTEERRRLYQQVLEPFLLPLLMADDEAEAASALQTAAFASSEYKRGVFELTLYASDDVVRAFGDITNKGDDPASNPLVLWARLLLAIRKSVGNKGTRLTTTDILRTTINDLDANPEILKQLGEVG